MGNEPGEFWRHHSNLLWSRVQTATAIEVAILAGWFNITDKSLFSEYRSWLLCLGIVLLLLVMLLMARDAQYMAVAEQIRDNGIPQPLPPILGLRGRQIAILAAVILIGVNVVLLARSCCITSKIVNQPTSAASSAPSGSK